MGAGFSIFNDLEWPLTPISRSRHFSTLNISETTRYRAIITIERQQEVVCALSNGDIFNDLDGPLTRFLKVTVFLKSNISYTVRFRDKVSREHNRKPYPVYRMVPLSMTSSDLWSGFQGHDIFWSRISENRRVLKTKLLLYKRKQ